jgi:hypothetical protein
MAIYYKKHMKHINALFGHNAELLKPKEGVTYCYHWALKG